MSRLPVLVLSLAALVACNNKASEPEPSADPGPASTPGPKHAARLVRDPRKPPSPSGPADVAYDTPPTWTVGTANRMRKATYVVPRASGDPEDGELSVSQAGGSVDQNIARWAQQLGKTAADAKRSERTANGIKVTVVEIHGDYSAMTMPGARPSDEKPIKKPGFALLGAIVETSPPTFFKLVGPEKTVQAAQRDFDKLVDGLRAK